MATPSFRFLHLSRALSRSTFIALALGIASSASAANVLTGTVVHNANPGVSVVNVSSPLFYFDINEDGTNDFFIKPQAAISFFDIPAGGGFGPGQDLTSFVSNGQPFNVDSPGLALGDIVGPDLIFLESDGSPAGALMVPGESYYGFSFVNGTTNYGWMKFSVTAATRSTTSVTVLEWAFDISGASIAVGATASAIPEASTTTLAMGAAALALGVAVSLRRRKAPLSGRA